MDAWYYKGCLVATTCFLPLYYFSILTFPMVDIVNSNTALWTPNAAPSSSHPITPLRTHIWNDTNTQNQTAVVKKIADQNCFSINNQRHNMEEQYFRVAKEIKGHYLVRMSPKEFMETFMLWNVNTPDTY